MNKAKQQRLAEKRVAACAVVVNEFGIDSVSSLLELLDPQQVGVTIAWELFNALGEAVKNAEIADRYDVTKM